MGWPAASSIVAVPWPSRGTGSADARARELGVFANPRESLMALRASGPDMASRVCWAVRMSLAAWPAPGAGCGAA